MRINKYLASCGVASRRKSEEYIKEGRVKVNGKVVFDLATDVCKDDEVLLDGRPLSHREAFEYYMLNKPRGYISTAKDDRGRRTVLELVKSNNRIYPVGRLDCDSEGLILLTNDGELTYKLTHPKNEISKTYIVKIDGSITDEQLERLRMGVVIDNYKLHPCKIYVQDRNQFKTTMKIVMFEGRNREIRKMFETEGKRVVFLKRVQIANLNLGNLQYGQYRQLTKKEIEYLKNL